MTAATPGAPDGMQPWTGVVLALSESGSEEMGSRLVTYLHPVAGRPLIWHAVAGLATLQPAPERVLVVAGVDVIDEAFADLPVPVEVTRVGGDARLVAADAGGWALLVDAEAYVAEDGLQALLGSGEAAWLGDDVARAVAAWLPAPAAARVLSAGEPLAGVAEALGRRRAAPDGRVLRVRDRVQLSRVVHAVRDRLVQRLMRAGATFLLPESVLVDVDVRVGRDSIIYPGVVLEGQTTIGDETVVGPGCRVIDSWIGSGVELKGWNYVSHTSIRNRAILEPYVRRGFD